MRFFKLSVVSQVQVRERKEITVGLADIRDDQGRFTVISEELRLVLGLPLSTHKLSGISSLQPIHYQHPAQVTEILKEEKNERRRD